MSRRSILVVDDEPGMRAMLTFDLTREGFDVDTAEDGQAAIERLAVRTYDLVLLDVHMPRLSGDEVLRIVRERWPTLRVIVLHSGMDVFEISDHAGAAPQALLEKPFVLEDLTRAIERVLG